VSGRWYEIGFTDEPKELQWQRFNIAHIGDIEDVQADDQWHTARFNLYEMLRTSTANTIVDEMVMADWDVSGYMKLQYGSNAKGATYYIDNFLISRDIAPGLAMETDRILVDDFNRMKETNALGGLTKIFQDSSTPRLKVNFSEDDAHGRGRTLALTYDVSPDGSFAGYTSLVPDLDLRGFQALSFYVKSADREHQDLLIGLRDRNGDERKLPVGLYAPEGVNGTWQQVRIPLAAFSGKLDWSNIAGVLVAFERAQNPSGTLLLDSIAFERKLGPVLVEDFERPDLSNRLGGKHWTYAFGAAAVSGASAKTPELNGIYGISFGGNIGDVYGYDDGLNYAGWATQLRGIDCSHCGTLSLRLRGAQGGEQPNIYLDDGNFRWSVRVSDYASLSTEWQDVSIPLADFEEYGVDLTHLEELQIVFEWERISGTVYVDDIHFGQLEAADERPAKDLQHTASQEVKKDFTPHPEAAANLRH
jgi:hypothetical protein